MDEITEEKLLSLGFRKLHDEFVMDGTGDFTIQQYDDGWYYTGSEGCKFGKPFNTIAHLKKLFFALEQRELK